MRSSIEFRLVLAALLAVLGAAAAQTLVYGLSGLPASLDAVDIAPDELVTIEEDASLRAVIADGDLNVGYLAFHQANEPFDDVRVRRAVAQAIDREAIVEAFFGGLGVTAEDHLPPSFFGHGEPWPYDYDPERAQELLAEAGYPDGFSTELWYMPVSRPCFPAPQPTAGAMASLRPRTGPPT